MGIDIRQIAVERRAHALVPRPAVERQVLVVGRARPRAIQQAVRDDGDDVGTRRVGTARHAEGGAEGANRVGVEGRAV